MYISASAVAPVISGRKRSERVCRPLYFMCYSWCYDDIWEAPPFNFQSSFPGLGILMKSWRVFHYHSLFFISETLLWFYPARFEILFCFVMFGSRYTPWAIWPCELWSRLSLMMIIIRTVNRIGTLYSLIWTDTIELIFLYCLPCTSPVCPIILVFKQYENLILIQYTQ